MLSVPDLRRVLLLEGTNDIGGGSNAPPAPANQVIHAIKLIIRRVHARNVAIVGATILPMCNAAGSSREQVRTAVNNWIRTSARSTRARLRRRAPGSDQPDEPDALIAGVGVGISSSVVPHVTNQLAMARLSRGT